VRPAPEHAFKMQAELMALACTWEEKFGANFNDILNVCASHLGVLLASLPNNPTRVRARKIVAEQIKHSEKSAREQLSQISPQSGSA
jgi:hypothetical protein